MFPSMPRLLLTAVALAVSLPARARAATPVPPAPERYVTDASGVLEASRADALNEKLAAFERRTSTQVLVWIAPRVPEGATPEELGAEAIRAWGVGQRGKDNGAILFVFTGDRKTRLATGYGLEGAIPDAVAKRILADVMRPHLSRGDYAAGIDAGVDAILAAAAGEDHAGRGRTVAERARAAGSRGIAVWALLCAAVVVMIVAAVRRCTVLLVLLGLAGLAGIAALIVGRLPPELASQAFVGGLLGLFSLALAILRSFRFPGATWSSPSAGDASSSFDAAPFSSSTPDSSSSFDGGGGDSGGGGASDHF